MRFYRDGQEFYRLGDCGYFLNEAARRQIVEILAEMDRRDITAGIYCAKVSGQLPRDRRIRKDGRAEAIADAIISAGWDFNHIGIKCIYSLAMTATECRTSEIASGCRNPIYPGSEL